MRFKNLWFTAFILFICIQLGIAQSDIALNRACYQSSAANYDNTAQLATDGNLNTSWISKQGSTEWIYVDLGKLCQVSKISINWDKAFAKAYRIEISNDGPPEKPINWLTVYRTSNGNGGSEEIGLKKANARYVKVICTQPAVAGSYAIKEIKVTGSGGLYI